MVNCSDHGDLEGNECSCDWGWFNNETAKTNCSVPGDTDGNWGSDSWISYRVIFSILYFILFSVSFCKLYTTIKLDKIRDCKRLLYRLFRSPRNMCLLFLMVIGLLRLIWIAFDPYSLKGLDRITERLLYETVFPFIYGLYSSVLLVWGGLYQGMRSEKSDPFRILRMFIMGMMIIAFPVSITLSVLKGKRMTSQWEIIGAVFVSFGMFTLLCGFLIFGVMLYCYVEKKRNEEPSIEINQDEVGSMNSADMLQDKSRSHVISIAFGKTRQISSQDSEKSWPEYLSFQYEEVSQNKEIVLESLEEVQVPRKKSARDSKQGISVITETDRSIFRKLCFLLMISTFLGILILIFIIFLTKFNKNYKPKTELTLIYIISLFELFSCWMIFFVFTAQIKVKDKKNLRHFTYISMKMRKKEPKIRLPVILKNIKSRLRNFYS